MPLPPHTQQYVDAFLAGIKPVEDAYGNDTFAYLAVKGPDGFVLVQGSVFLNVDPRSLPIKRFRSQRVCAGHHQLAELKVTRSELIEQICSGKIPTPDGELLFPGNSSGSQYGAMYEPFHAAGSQTQSRVNVLSIFGGESRELLDVPALNWELRAAPTPYNGLQDLLNEFHLGTLRGGPNSVEIAASAVALIDGASSIAGERAKIAVRVAPGLNPGKITVGLRILDQGRVVHRTQLTGDKFEWTATESHQFGTAEVTVPRAAVVECFPGYNGVAQQYYWLVDPQTFQNPRRAAYEAFDPQFESLKDLLTKVRFRGLDAKNFESAVSWLFWILGFSPAHLGGTPRTQDAVDAILCTPAGHFAVVEITTGLLRAENKLPLVYDRCQAVRRNLDAANAKHLRVLPVLVTSKSLEEVRPDMAQAEKLGIFVVTREGIDHLAERTLVAGSADELYSEAEQAVRTAIERHQDLPNILSGIAGAEPFN